MKQNQIMFLIGGLIIGLLIGVIGVGALQDDDSGLDAEELRAIIADENLRVQNTIISQLSSMQETQAQFNTRPVEVNADYFLVDLEQTQLWLEDSGTEISEELAADFESVSGISTATDLGEYFTTVEEGGSLDNVLSTIYSSLLEQVSSEDFEVCLGLENDPYSTSGPGLFLYLQVPQEVSDEMPKEWELLSGPKEDSFLWSTECYTPSETPDGETDGTSETNN